MNRLLFLIAAAIASSIGTMSASAQERGWHRDGTYREWNRDAIPRDWRYRHDYPRPYYAPRYWAAPVRPYRYYDPLWVYPGPALVYSYPLYEPAPVIVERVYERRRFYDVEPAERHERYEERSYAQIAPPEPAPRPAAPPAPRLERYTLSAREIFEFDKATLRKPQPKLDEIADVMKRNPQIDGVTIAGYTDRIGSDAYNLRLSQRRADAVKTYLVGKGVAAGRLTAIGKGKANPLVQCSDTRRADLIKCLEPNRRVEVEQITVERRVR